jgi:hypothetical protein
MLTMNSVTHLKPAHAETGHIQIDGRTLGQTWGAFFVLNRVVLLVRAVLSVRAVHKKMLLAHAIAGA